MFKYEVILYWSEEDKAFIADVPELSGCCADGETMAQAVENIETIISDWIETAKAMGRVIPEPRGRLNFA